jgi:hypothetical protein
MPREQRVHWHDIVNGVPCEIEVTLIDGVNSNLYQEVHFKGQRIGRVSRGLYERQAALFVQIIDGMIDAAGLSKGE